MKYKRLFVSAACLFLLGACSSPERTVPADLVFVRFDPAHVPPIVPVPNDLAVDKTTGLLAVTPAPDATETDKAFVAYLNTLDGFPMASTGSVAFDGRLRPDTVNEATVRVFDTTAGNAPVPGVTIAYSDVTHSKDPENRGQITIKGPGGLWQPGHSYAVALLSGAGGLRGAEGQDVAGTAAWLLMRSENPLTTCDDLTSPDCRSTTDLIPSDKTDPAERIADQAKTAVRLEEVRRHYKPALDALVAAGIARADIALLWSFNIVSTPQMVFNPQAQPARVPTPTDLAIDPATGLVNAPISPTASPAEQEFTLDYLNTLSGFPAASTATVEVSAGDIDPATLTPDSVRVIDRTAGSSFTPVINYVESRKRIELTAPGGWPRGHTFEVAMIADKERGLRTKDGKIPIATEVFALLRGTTSLVTCADLTSPTCESSLTITPIAPADAVRLETIRQDYSPLFDELEKEGIGRLSVPILWVFTIAPNPEAFFDPANSFVPFPNDLVLTPAPGSDGQPAHVRLPYPEGASDAVKKTIDGLNQLDGFSTTAAAISENNDAAGALGEAELDPATLPAGGGFVSLSPGSGQPDVSLCLNCASTPLPGGGSPDAPQQLQFVPNRPLDPSSTYAGYLTRDLKDTSGQSVIATPAFALMRSANPLIDEGGKSLVPIVSDEQAQQLEPARLTLKPTMDALEAMGKKRRDVVLAFGYTTQSTRTVVEALAALPQQMGAALPTAVTHMNDDLTQVLTPHPVLGDSVNQNPFPSDKIGAVYFGRMSLPDPQTGPEGTIDLANVKVVEAPFVLTLPAAAAPAAGYPVVVWGHPLTSYRMSMLGLANALAGSGKALLAIDLPRHGDRATCVGAKDALGIQPATSDDDACADAAAQKCETSAASPSYGRCVARVAADRASCSYSPVPAVITITDDAGCFAQDQGRCLPDGKCEGGTWKAVDNQPAISGWNFINSNFFSVRDNLLTPVSDLAQIVRVIEATGPGSLSATLGASKLDPAQIDYVGMSFGGVTGAIASSFAPKVRRVALNAAGADLPSLLLYGLTPEAQGAFLAGAAENGLTMGTPAFDQFIGILRWILDPADAANQARFALEGAGAPATRAVLIQYVEGDPVMPNANTERLIAAASAAAKKPAVVKNTGAPAVVGADRHAYLITGLMEGATAAHQQLTAQAQAQVVNFINGGAP